MNKLRPYQQEDVERILQHDSLGIFNEQRTGKTPTSLYALDKKCSGRILIVATASMIYRWADEAKTWTNRNVYVYEGTQKQRTKVLSKYKADSKGILIISYGLLKNTKAYTGLVKELKKVIIIGLIVDEVHRAVGRKTANFKALRTITDIPYRLYLTGTPAPNHPSQVWSILTMIEPKQFTSYWRFVETFFYIDIIRLPYSAAVDHIRTPAGFIETMKDDYVKMLDKYSIMRKRKDVMPWLPEHEEPTKIRLPLTPAQTKYLKEMQKYYETEHVIAQGILDQLLRYRQICNAPQLLQLKGSSPKIDWIKQYLSDYPEKQIVIFSRFTQFIDIIKEKIPSVCVMVGRTPASERNQLINDFQSAKIQVLIIQIDTGKEGITLDSADVLIFADIYPPASDILQAKDRIVATSPERNKPKEIIQLMMADSYDEVLYDIVDAKIELTDIANNYINYIERK